MLNNWEFWGVVGLAILCSHFYSGNATFLFGKNADSGDLDESVPYHRNRRAVKLPANYSVFDLPPTPSGGPLSVKLSIVIVNVRDVREIGEEITVEMNIRVYWKDTRLSSIVEHLVNSPSTSDQAEFVLLPPSLLKEIWSPDLFIDHVKKVDQPTIMAQTASLRMYPDYTLRYSTRLTLTMACPMDFHYYPADTQRCHFDVKSYAYADSKMVLAWRDKYGAHFDEDIDLSNFFTGLDNPNTFVQKTQTGNTYSGLRFTVLLTRKLSYHLMQTYLPSVILVIVSWLSFLISSDSVPGRMTVLMTCLLTLIAMFSSVRQSTPNVSYVKFIDVWMFFCVFFVFLALMEFTLVLKIKTMKFKKDEPTTVGKPTESSLRSGKSQVTPVYYPTPPHTRTSKNSPEETELTEYGIPWRGPGDYGASTVGDSMAQRSSFENQFPPMFSRTHPAPTKPFTQGTPPEPPTPPPVQPPSITRNEQIIAKVEHIASLVIPFLFICFCSLYWPSLLISSDYFD